MKIHSNEIATSRTVPRKTLPTFSSAVDSLFRFISQDMNSLLAWTFLTFFLKTVMAPLPHKKDRWDSTLLQRLQKFNSGEFKLLSQVLEIPKQDSGEHHEVNYKKVVKLVELGRLSEAASKLSPTPLAPAGPATLEKLKSKHPDGPKVEKIDGIAPEKISITREELVQVLKRFKRWSASGHQVSG